MIDTNTIIAGIEGILIIAALIGNVIQGIRNKKSLEDGFKKGREERNADIDRREARFQSVIDADKKLILGIAHDRIIYLGEQYVKRGYVTPDEYSNLIDYLYEAYHEMGGNGSAERMVEQVKKLPMCEHADAPWELREKAKPQEKTKSTSRTTKNK